MYAAVISKELPWSIGWSDLRTVRDSIPISVVEILLRRTIDALHTLRNVISDG